MVFLEAQARLLLLVHLVLGGALVAASTHLVVWLRGYRRGEFSRHRSARRFAWIVAALFGAAFLAGAFLYPTYRVIVRAEYLERAVAIEGRDSPEQLAAVARVFDVKEHLVALALPLALACAVLFSVWDPRRDGAAIVPVAVGMAWAIAASAWFAALVGAWTAAVRAV